MSIELTMFFVLWFVSTEFIFFKYIRYDFDGFMHEKILSIFLGFFLSFILFGIPAIVATGMGVKNVEDIIGNIFYVWYYGVFLIIGLFFDVNYLIYKKGEKNEQ